jgi:hypothetical protein
VERKGRQGRNGRKEGTYRSTPYGRSGGSGGSTGGRGRRRPGGGGRDSENSGGWRGGAAVEWVGMGRAKAYKGRPPPASRKGQGRHPWRRELQGPRKGKVDWAGTASVKEEGGQRGDRWLEEEPGGWGRD